MLCRCILPEWASIEFPHLPKIKEGEYTDEELLELNAQFYNIHYLPNYPSHYQPGVKVDGSQIDVFEYVYVDMDLKEKVYASKEEFLAFVMAEDLTPSKVIDSGNGVHVYWRVKDLDALTFLKLQRRLMRKYKTDEAVAKIFQLMRPPGFVNTKHKDAFKLCSLVHETDKVYSAEELDKALPALTLSDAEYCTRHYNMTYQIKDASTEIASRPPLKFDQLLRSNKEVRDLWADGVEDRSKADWRLAHIMQSHGFTKQEVVDTLVNSAKARTRAPIHRINYAVNIIDKIWSFETNPEFKKEELSQSVFDILHKAGDKIKGERFPCHRYLDDTHHGFRLGQVVGLVAGSGVGKTAVALNMFMGFVKNNPNYQHFFIPLEQPANEIADRWKTMCGENDQLHKKVHVLGNYNDDGSFRHLSFDEIKDYLLEFKEKYQVQIGCVVIDHIGALKKKGKNGENQDLMDICHQMKAFAIQTNTLLVMQSQAPREKAGIGDLELNKDAAYGTVYFESYCDYLITIWQPVKRCYIEDGCPTVTAFKFCKIRHKKRGLDTIKEDVCYYLYFDSKTEHLRSLTDLEEKSFDYYLGQATNLRKKDRKTDIVSYTSVKWDEKEDRSNGTTENHQNNPGA